MLPIPIGKPISNSTAYILDTKGRLLPIGVPGELCVGGDGVAKGYLNKDDLTNAVFLLILSCLEKEYTVPVIWRAGCLMET